MPLTELPDIGDLVTDDGGKQEISIPPRLWIVLVKPKLVPQHHKCDERDYEYAGQLLQLPSCTKYGWSLYRWEWKNWTILVKAELTSL